MECIWVTKDMRHGYKYASDYLWYAEFRKSCWLRKRQRPPDEIVLMNEKKEDGRGWTTYQVHC